MEASKRERVEAELKGLCRARDYPRAVSLALETYGPEIRKLMMVAHEQGFEVGRTNSGHYKVMVPEGVEPPNGVATAFLPGTTSDRRSVHRCIVKLKDIGVKFPKN